MQKVLIAEHSESLATSLEKTLQTEWEVHICTNSYPMIDLLQYLQPEALVLDLNLQPKDGLSLLTEASSFLPPAIVATTNIVNEQIAEEAKLRGVGCLVRIPCSTEYVKDQLSSLCPKIPKDIVWHLHLLSFNPKLAGYHCLVAAISTLANNPTFLIKQVYPVVAALCGYDDIRNVERVIRSAITSAWKKRDRKIWASYFPLNKKGDVDKPSNKYFIARIAEEI